MPITPCLWFNHNAVEAAAFYAAIFPNSRILTEVPAGGDNPSTKSGDVLMVELELDGLRLTLLNGGPQFTFNEAISFVISCESQDEVDYFWDRLIDGGGEESQCGWLKDRFGVSWQVVPTELPRYLAGGAWPALMDMGRIDIATLEAACGS